MTITKAVVPAAGLGTRFLPATKAIPKELLPIVDKPSIQYIIEEAVASGIRDVVLITGRGKTPIRDHFDVAYELEDILERQGKTDLLRTIQAISQMVHLISVRQKNPLGLGHAVLCAKQVIAPHPFAVLLPDDLIDSPVPCTRAMIALFEMHGSPVVAIQRVPADQAHRYGIIQGEKVSERLYRIQNLVEKPAPGAAPSDLAVIGRYILPSEIFEILEQLPPGKHGEVQLTDALIALKERQPLYGYEFEGDRYDAGEKLGFLQANIMYALKDPDLGPRLRQFLLSRDLLRMCS